MSIPIEYQLVTYIENTSTSRLSCGTLPSGSSLLVKAKCYKETQATAESAMVYIRDTNAAVMELFLSATTNLVGAFSSAAYLSTSQGYSAGYSSVNPYGRETIFTAAYGPVAPTITGVSNDKQAVAVSNSVGSGASGQSNGTTTTFGGETIGLFANPTAATVPFVGRIYWVEIYVDGVLVKKLNPVYRKADGVIGMYDEVSDSFYTNVGSGTFLKGDDIKSGGGSPFIRRRTMGSGIDCPYISDGLIFWLDGIDRGGVTGQWKDLIGGKIFTLYNVTEKTTGVAFSGGAYGLCNGAVSSNWQTETLEVATNNVSHKNACLLCPPKISTAGIGIIFSSPGGTFNINIDGNSAPKAQSNSTATFKKLSANKVFTVCDGTTTSFTNSDTWGANTTGNTYLGKRSNDAYRFTGTIYSVRIYNRLLSVAEMQFNQAVDAARFNL